MRWLKHTTRSACPGVSIRTGNGGYIRQEVYGKAKRLECHTPYISTYNDASMEGFGTIHGCDWKVGAFDSATDERLKKQVGHRHASAHINILEMWAAFCEAQTWGHQWRNSTVVMVTDNETVRTALCSGRSKSRDVMHFVRRLFWIAVDNNFDVQSVYVRSADNTICNALSRWGTDSMERIAVADGRAQCAAATSSTSPLLLPVVALMKEKEAIQRKYYAPNSITTWGVYIHFAHIAYGTNAH